MDWSKVNQAGSSLSFGDRYVGERYFLEQKATRVRPVHVDPRFSLLGAPQ